MESNLKLVFLATFIFLFTSKIFPQGIDDPGRRLQMLMDKPANFYEVETFANSYFEANPSLTTEEDGIYTEYKRWQMFWSSRISNFGDKAGDLKYIHNSYANYILGNPNQVLANYVLQPVCTTSSVFVANWTSLGPMSFPQQWIGKIQSILVDESDLTHNTVYVGAPNGGVFKTTDFMTTSITGPTWVCITENTGLPGLWINSMVIDPVTQDLYLATGNDRDGYNIGILGLHQNGQYFTTAMTINPNYGVPPIRKIIIDPNDHQRMFALSPGFIYGTIDGWNSFFSTAPTPLPLTESHFWEINFDPENSDYVLATGININLSTLSKSGILMTCDGAGLWSDISTSLPTNVDDYIMMDVSMDGNSKAFYIIYRDGSIEHMYKSSNNGNTTHGISTVWTFVRNIQTNKIKYDSEAHLKINPIDPTIIYAEGGGRTVIQSTDGGLNFVSVSAYNLLSNGIVTHADIRCIKIIPGTLGNDLLFVGTDGGIMFSNNNSATNFLWQDKNGTGLNITQFYALSGAKFNHSNYFFAGAQDNGGFVYNNGNWSRTAIGGDEYEGGVENANQTNIYGTASSGGVPASLYKNNNSTPIFSFNNKLTFFIDHLNDNRLYTAYHEIYSSTDHGATWPAISNFTNQLNDYNHCKNIAAVAVDPGNSQHILACFEGSTNDKDLNSCTNLCTTGESCPG